MKRLKRTAERLIEGLLTLSGGVTSLAILLIIVFLFKEGIGLFNSPSVERGYALCVNASNPVESLTAAEIKRIFDYEDDAWEPYRFAEDDIDRIADIIAQTPNIIAFLPIQFVPDNAKVLPTGNIRITDFFCGQEWLPTATPASLHGLLPLLLGTLWVSIFAILIALPLGLGVAIYLSELASERTRKLLKPAIELLAGIPSVVYGFFGLVVETRLIASLLDLPVGETALAGSMILAIMALPTIITIAEDAMRNTPRAVREASLALGATQWQTIYRVIVPYASSGIIAAVVLGIGRAIGETMAVLMVTGNAAVMPRSLFESVRTIPATIAAELGEAPAGGAHYQSLFLLGCILFIITMIISASAEIITKQKHSTGL